MSYTYNCVFVRMLTELTIVVSLDHSIQLGPAVSWVKANAGQTGLYRVNYDVTDWIQFVTMLRNDHTVSVCTLYISIVFCITICLDMDTCTYVTYAYTFICTCVCYTTLHAHARTHAHTHTHIHTHTHTH